MNEITLTLRAFAKVNLTLDVTGRRPDGYHTIESVMQRIDLGDTVTLTENDSGRITLSCGAEYIPSDSRNTAWKAAKLFYDRFPRSFTGLHIHIEKRTPVGAGLGGGSADAAAVLTGLDRLSGHPLNREELLALGAGVGADVPFCILGGTALAGGIGEELTVLPKMPDCFFALCKPAYGCSTQELYQRCDRMRIREHPDTRGFLAALEAGDLPGLARRMFNVFEALMPERARDINEVKLLMLDCGALSSVMTGSGSVIFGVFALQAQAAEAVRRLQESGYEAYLARPIS